MKIGKILSDPIEKRFGWYRQLGGANYYLAVTQFLQSEKKIRLRCLISIGDLSFKDACEILKSSRSAVDIKAEANELFTLLDFEIEYDVNGNLHRSN